MIRLLSLTLCLVFVSATSALSAEQINRYDVKIFVERDGDILVTETIDVTAERNQIRRGIFRDLPRFYKKDGVDIPYRYKIKSIRRNGKKEPYAVSRTGNGVRWRIGDADVYLDYGRHVYEIEYSVKNQIRYFQTHDELYWNAIGQYWAFPIAAARIDVTLPDGAIVAGVSAYTGRFGEQQDNYRYARENGSHVFTATQPFSAREGMTISLSVEKGAIDPPSAGDKRADWWALNGSLVVLSLGAIAISGFHFHAWRRVGIDPPKGPVFPRYEPPKNHSPAGVHYVYHRRLNGHDALIASIVNLAINKWIKIEPVDKKKTTLTRFNDDDSRKPAFPAERVFLKKLLARGSSRTIGGKTDTTFTSAYRKFQASVSKRFGSEYFKWNFGFIVVAVAVSILVVIVSVNMAVQWTGWHFAGLGALLVVNLLFAYLLPAATEKGQAVRTEIEGFKLYLEKAEKLHINTAEIGAGSPPVLTVERYERFLPYAIALGVEKPWTKHFEKSLPTEAEAYRPHWSSSSRHGYRSLHAANSALVSSMSSGVSSAMPQSSGSSGSGGGGFSGGGGGGGGGGGW